MILHASSLITAKRLNDEVVFRVPRPQNTKLADEVAFLDVASRKLSLVVVPPLTQYKIQGGAGLKVLAGRGMLEPSYVIIILIATTSIRM